MKKSFSTKPLVAWLGVFCLLATALPASLMAQTPPSSQLFDFKRITQTADLSVATKGNFSIIALSVNRLHGLGKSHRFRIGYGLRLASAFGTETDYRTAPAKLTSGKQSIATLFSENIPANLDTIRFAKTQINSLNASISLEYAVTRKFSVGANIDAIGFSFGGSQTGTFISKGRTGLTGTAQPASPTSFNLLLIGDSDLGGLSSEYYVRYQATPKFSVRGGISFQFTEYTTTRRLRLDNDRFRSKDSMPMLALSYHF